jgi:hypothetical protein
LAMFFGVNVNEFSPNPNKHETDSIYTLDAFKIMLFFSLSFVHARQIFDKLDRKNKCDKIYWPNRISLLDNTSIYGDTHTHTHTHKL